MLAQLGIWATCSDFQNWAQALFYKNSSEATAILNSDKGVKFLSIAGLTVGTAAACYFSGTGQIVIAIIKGAWNKLVAIITGFLPPNFILIINGIRIVPL